MKTKCKLRALQTAASPEQPALRPMLSLEESKAILNKHGIVYTDEEIAIIRDFMYCIAELTASHYQRLAENTIPIIPIHQNDKNEEKSIPIHSRKYRRAG